MHTIHVQSTNCKTIFYCFAFEIVESLVEQVKNDYSFTITMSIFSTTSKENLQPYKKYYKRL